MNLVLNMQKQMKISVLKVLKTNSHPGKKPVLHPACKITNLCPLLRGIFRASEGEGYNIVYLDETWVDTHHTASHQ
jgi:hypothetical protein